MENMQELSTKEIMACGIVLRARRGTVRELWALISFVDACLTGEENQIKELKKIKGIQYDGEDAKAYLSFKEGINNDDISAALELLNDELRQYFGRFVSMQKVECQKKQSESKIERILSDLEQSTKELAKLIENYVEGRK